MNETQSVVRTCLVGTTVVAHLIGDLDVSVSTALKVALQAVIEIEDITRVVLDWSRLTYLDSVGQVTLVDGLIRPARARNIEVFSIEETIHPNILKVLKITGLDRVYGIHKEKDIGLVG